MKKITIFICTFILCGFSIITAQQFDFPAQGATTVAQGSPVTLSINDMANTAGVTAGVYDSFSVSADWIEVTGGPYSSEADLTMTTTAGSIVVDPPTSGQGANANPTTLIFSGDLSGLYDPSTDGFLEIVLNQSWSGTTAEWTNIVVTLFEAPACEVPTNVELRNITNNFVGVFWTDEFNAIAYEAELGAAGFAPGTGAEIGLGSNTTGSSGIGLSTPNTETDYDIYIRSNCDTDGFSEWDGPYSFTSLCSPVAPDYTADMSVNVPDACWEEATTGDLVTGPTNIGASDWRQGTSYALGSSNAINLYFNNDSEWLLSPIFDLSTGGPYQLEINVAVTNWNAGTVDDTMGSDDEVQLLMSTDGGINWTNLTTWNAANEPPLEGIEYVEDLTGMTSTVRFAVWATDGAVDDAEDYDFHVGKFRVRAIPSCAEPTAVMVSNVTATSADLGWTAGGSETLWDIELVDITAAATVTGNPTTSGVANPYTIMGLTAENDYEVYVRADCSGSESSWVGPIAFTTDCAAIAAPYSEDFESFTVATSAFNSENCWTGTNIGGYLWEVAATTDTSSGGTGPGSGISDGNYLFTEATSGSAGDAIDLISPLIDLSALTAPSLAFDYHMFGGDMGTLDVIVSSGGMDTNVFSISGQQQTAETDAFATQIVDLAAYAGQIIQVTFRGTKGADFESDIAIDSVAFDEAPSCFDPSILTATNILSDSADLGWTENGSATIWNVEIVDVTAMGTATGTPTATGVTNPYMATGLVGDNEYAFYVQADCGGGELSAWVGPFNFITECAAIVPEYTADMSVNVPDSCWDEAGSGDLASGPMSLGASDWRDGTSYALGSSNAINLFSDVDSEWLLSPTFDLSTGGPHQLEINVAVTNWNAGTVDDTMGSDDEVQLLMSTDGGASWTNITTWNAANEPPVGGIEYVEDLTAITGNVQFAIWATDGAVDDAEDYDFHVGKFRIRAIPSCADPATVMNTVLTDTTSEFTWAAGGTETTWEYANLPSPSTEPASGTSTMTGMASFSGLTPETAYDFYVRSDCGGTFSSWVLISYTTPPTPPTNDDCINAIPLTPGAVYTDNPVDGTVLGANVDAESAACGSTGPGVWYSIVVPASGDITIQTGDDSLGGTGFDSVVEAFSGTCGALTSIGCDDDGVPGFGDAYSQLELTGLTGGETIYVRVWEYGGNDVEPFSISAYSASLSIDTIENESAFTYYPNPVENALTLNAQNTIEDVTVFNMLGQQVLRVAPNAVDSELDMSNLEAGTYFIKVTIANVTETVRVIKK
jgi:hypothetical protein